jgi:hypothetical protein
MKIICRTVLTVLFLQYAFNPVFATETRITQLFITNEWQEYRHTFLYSTQGAVQLETKYSQLNNDEWLPHSQTEWYRAPHNIQHEIVLLVIQRERVFENGEWQNINEIETQYHLSGTKREETFFRYISGVRTPIKTVKYEWQNGGLAETREYRYENGIPVLSLVNTFQRENDFFTQWTVGVDLAFISRVTYSVGGRLLAMLVQEEVGNERHNRDSITWFYNDEGQVFSQRSRKWNEQGGHWVNTQIVNFEYDATGNLTAETYLQWSGVHWENIYRYEYQYENNIQNRRTLQAHIHRDWRDMISIHYSDFQNGKAQEIWSEFDFWGGNAGELTASHIPFFFNDELVVRRAERIRINYEEFSNITNNVNHRDLIIQVYPNPSDGIFYLNAEQHEMLSWKVLNINGQMIKSYIQKSHSGVIDLTELPQGIYILQVETSIGTQQKKLIKK